jgi:hypothetical protein
MWQASTSLHCFAKEFWSVPGGALQQVADRPRSQFSLALTEAVCDFFGYA